jgi:hypothetical protein
MRLTIQERVTHNTPMDMKNPMAKAMIASVLKMAEQEAQKSNDPEIKKMLLIGKGIEKESMRLRPRTMAEVYEILNGSLDREPLELSFMSNGEYRSIIIL